MKNQTLTFALICACSSALLIGCPGGTGGITPGKVRVGVVYVLEQGATSTSNGSVAAFEIYNNGQLGLVNRATVGPNPKDLEYDPATKSLFVASDIGRIDQFQVTPITGLLLAGTTTTLTLPAPIGSHQHTTQSLEVMNGYLYAGTAYYKSNPNTDGGNLFAMQILGPSSLGNPVDMGGVPGQTITNMYHSGLANNGTQLLSLSEGNQNWFVVSLSNPTTMASKSSVSYPPSSLRDIEITGNKLFVYASQSGLSGNKIGMWNGFGAMPLGTGPVSTFATGRTDIAIDDQAMRLYCVGDNSNFMDIYSITPQGSANEGQLTWLMQVPAGFNTDGVETTALSAHILISSKAANKIRVFDAANPNLVVYTESKAIRPTKMLAVVP